MTIFAMCPSCAEGLEARALVLENGFWIHAVYALVPFVAAGIAIRAIARTRLVIAGLVLGVGLGGFVDGILLHQILQWHNMLSSVVPPTDLVTMKFNMVWDGLFHALTWTTVALGIALLFHAGRRADAVWSGRVLLGSLLGGWGLFDLIEGLFDHQLLGLHHVHPGQGQLAWDFGFLAVGGLGLAALGYALARRA